MVSLLRVLFITDFVWLLFLNLVDFSNILWQVFIAGAKSRRFWSEFGFWKLVNETRRYLCGINLLEVYPNDSTQPLAALCSISEFLSQPSPSHWIPTPGSITELEEHWWSSIHDQKSRRPLNYISLPNVKKEAKMEAKKEAKEETKKDDCEQL
ncbi:hypothetical protein B0H19DRAFT_1080272 [Mycena capillaripes]|nr:hypothetical protein B0H19DRAFT_1080272 [Mycena capillaripes]